MMGGPQHEARVIRLNHEILEAITLPYPILCVQHLDSLSTHQLTQLEETLLTYNTT